MTISYIVSFIDKVALSEASIFGIRTDDVGGPIFYIFQPRADNYYRTSAVKTTAGSTPSSTSVTCLPNTPAPS